MTPEDQLRITGELTIVFTHLPPDDLDAYAQANLEAARETAKTEPALARLCQEMAVFAQHLRKAQAHLPELQKAILEANREKTRRNRATAHELTAFIIRDAHER